VKENPEHNGGDLVPSTNRELTRSSGLVRRGLEDLVKGQQGIGSRSQQHRLILRNEAGVIYKNPEWPLIEQVIRELDTGSGNSFCCLEVGDKWVQTLHGFNGYHVEWCLNSAAEDDRFAIWRASSLGGSSGVAELKKHDGYTNLGERRDLLHLDDVLGAFRAFYDGLEMPTSLAWRTLNLGLNILRSGVLRFPRERSVGLLYTYDSSDTKLDSLYGFTEGKYLGEAKGEITLPDNHKDLYLSATDGAASDISFFADLGADDLQSLSLLFLDVVFDERELRYIEHLTGLRRLFLSSQWFTDDAAASVQRLIGLEWLDLSHTKMTDKALRYLRQMSELQVVDLAHTLISDDSARQLSQLVSLKQVSLRNTSFGNTGLKDLCRLHTLLILDLSQTRITSDGLAPCRNLEELESLNLAYTAVTDAGLIHLQGLSKLETLVLSGTRITSAGLEYLKAMPALEWLNLSDTEIIDTDLLPLGNLTKLRGLGLDPEQTTANGESELKRLIPNCTIGDNLVP
jgi:Leucine-rich repeat (LRR) protein